jgi:putative ABC transport system substrate-binding protein
MTDRLRRQLLLAGAALAAFPASAQPAKRPYRIGFVRLGAYPIDASFGDAMKGMGWTEGRDFTVDSRFAVDDRELPRLASEMVALQPDVMIVIGGPAARAAKAATSKIPVLFMVTEDPVENGIVDSLAAPGRNLTGFMAFRSSSKMLAYLKEAIPGATRIAVAIPAGAPEGPRPAYLAQAEAQLGIRLDAIAAANAEEVRNAPAIARAKGFDAMQIPDLIWPFQPPFEDLAMQARVSRMPTMFYSRRFVEAGGLLSYGATAGQHWIVFARQADKIFKGANPAAMPVERATRFELVLNATTERTLGISLPRSFREQVTEVVS